VTPSPEITSRVARAVNAEPLSVPSVSIPGRMAWSRTAVSITVIASGAAAQAELPADDLAGAAVDDRVQVDPAVLGDPDRGHVEVP
jgi:hypothetical protein